MKRLATIVILFLTACATTTQNAPNADVLLQRDREFARTVAVNVQLARKDRQLASDIANLHVTTSRPGPDGMRLVPVRQIADVVETSSPQIIKRQELQRRVALYASAIAQATGQPATGVLVRI